MAKQQTAPGGLTPCGPVGHSQRCSATAGPPDPWRTGGPASAAEKAGFVPSPPITAGYFRAAAAEVEGTLCHRGLRVRGLWKAHPA